jgi:branched-chain amino acid transport system ATP-binding protein
MSARDELRVRGLYAGYGAADVIKDINLTVRSKEIVLLTGANGAGKSTTMNAIAGRLGARKGTVSINEAALPRRLDRRARLGVVLLPEQRSIFNSLTTAENLQVAGRLVDAGLDLFPELRDHLRRRAGLLSGGQQRILGLARSLAARPKFLLLDEMTLGLAPIIVSRLLDCLSEITASHDIGILLVEQHVHRALSIAHRGYVLSDGQVSLEGDAEKLRAHSAQIENAYLGDSLAANGELGRVLIRDDSPRGHG